MATQASEIILQNNQTSYADLLTFNTKTFKGAEIEYSIIRGDLTEFGNIYISYNRFLNQAQIIIDANFDDCGVRFCANVDADYIRLVYTSTDTGIQPIFKHSVTWFPL
jgi:hypothetical protein